jgi:two-component system, chemotaxis family, protein-glutamate methylesterase/glutaminase
VSFTPARASCKPIKVLVVEDSPRLRARIVRALDADPSVLVVGQASDGRAAVDLCLKLRPDVITMDVVLPVLTGLAATQQLMQICPTPILIISAAIDPGELVNTFAALAAGAVDVMEKPRPGGGDDEAWDRRLLSTVKLVARIQVITHLRRGADRVAGPAPSPHSNAAPTRPGATPPSPAMPSAPSAQSAQSVVQSPMWVRPRPEGGPGAEVPAFEGERRGFTVVAIGASTGGPAAVATVLSALPAGFVLPVLLVLHVSDTFGPAIASWLKTVSSRRVRLADHGEPLGTVGEEVIMAPPGQHLAVRRGVITLNRDPERHSCRPSVDVLFDSLALEVGPQVAACLLTGMGRDGATGLLAVHRSGGLTIAQDEATSVVFGMPGEAVRLGAAQHVLPVERIGPLLGRLTRAVVRPR